MPKRPHSPSPSPTRPHADPWAQTITSITPAIVSILFAHPTNFDTNEACNSQATGFIVDKGRGIVLTNRHVVGGGPFYGHLVLHNHEEVNCWPIYRDPIHDFGFLKFNPSDVKYLELCELQLCPELAEVGLEIRVVGNDAGEKLSILSGWISRLDRNVPAYGPLEYQDFNTFYLQAASSASGGSSGSPVVNVEGKVVALQAAGSTEAATTFFLPLDRVERALLYIQKHSSPPPRGTIQTQWYHKPFDEIRRLGLAPEMEEQIRKASDDIGMLVAEVVVPKGPAATAGLEQGDILVRLNGCFVTKFVPVAAYLDDNVGGVVEVQISRGSELMTLKIPIADKHLITPDRYVDCGGARVNNLSYNLAVSVNIPVEGVFVCEPSGFLNFDGGRLFGWMLKSINNTTINTIDEFIEAVKSVPDGKFIPVRYTSLADMHYEFTNVTRIDRHWYGFRQATRNDHTGLWDFVKLPKSLPAVPLEPASASFMALEGYPANLTRITHGFAGVRYAMPFTIEGFPYVESGGSMLVLDAELGIAVCSREVIPFDMGTINLVFATSICIPGRVVFLHPTYNLTFIRYDPKLLGTTPVVSAILEPQELKAGEQFNFIGIKASQKVVISKCPISDVVSLSSNYTLTVNSPHHLNDCVVPRCDIPRFRAINFEGSLLDSTLATNCHFGVLANDNGGITALWLRFLSDQGEKNRPKKVHYAVPVYIIQPILTALRRNEVPVLRHLAVDLCQSSLLTARHLGLSEDRLKAIESADEERRSLFSVLKCDAGSPASKHLIEADIILTVNKNIVTRINDLDDQFTQEYLDMTILRNGAEIDIRLPTELSSVGEVDHVVIWCGAIIHSPHRAVLQASRSIHSGAYVAARTTGSPASHANLSPGLWITHVNGHKIWSLTDLIGIVSTIPDNTYCRVKVITFDNLPCVLTVKTNEHYFPAEQLVRDSSTITGWRRFGFDKEADADTEILNTVSSVSAGELNHGPADLGIGIQ